MRVTTLYVDENLSFVEHSSLWKDCAFSTTKFTDVKVLKTEKFKPYPANNNFPPFWKKFNNIEFGATEIGELLFKKSFISLLNLAFTALLLTQPTEWKEKDQEGKKTTVGYKFQIGDADGTSIDCYLWAEENMAKAESFVGNMKVEMGLYGHYAEFVVECKYLF